MTNLELADALQAEFTGYEVVDVAAAVLRNLHTENTALRVTEDNLRQELQECQDQRRAAFRRIEELDAMRAQPPVKAELLCVCGCEWQWGNRSWELVSGPYPSTASAPPAPQQKPLTDEPDWRHPKIQGLIGSEARLRIAIDLIWQILENPEQEFTASDMEHWDTIHDKLKESLSVTRAIEAAATEPLLQRIAELEQRNRDLYEDVQRFRKHAMNEKAARMELERQLEEAQEEPTDRALEKNRRTVTYVCPVCAASLERQE